MDEYLVLEDIFSKSEADLVAMQQAFGRYYQVALGASLPEQGKRSGWMVWAMYLGMGKRHDYRDAVRAVDVPAQVILGADDLQSEEASRVYAEAFPGARFRVLQDAPHFPFIDQPDAFAAAVGGFLDDVGGGQSCE